MAPQQLPHMGGPGSPSRSKTAVSSPASSAANSPFTAEMQNRQARGKDPYDLDSEGSDDDDDLAPHGGSGSGGEGSSTGNIRRQSQRSGTPKKPEPYAVYDRRRTAAQILDSPELLMMAAMRDDASVPATRLKYTRVLCDLEDRSTPVPSRESPTRASTPGMRGGRSKQRTVSGKGGGSTM
ncbi:hypothetical protein GGR51DRAFT_462669 [Nemania sp. FL0031]|nr:hypothetical protein GGR51DRAFT_462669 [Nemania sp. FL0031]